MNFDGDGSVRRWRWCWKIDDVGYFLACMRMWGRGSREKSCKRGKINRLRIKTNADLVSKLTGLVNLDDRTDLVGCPTSTSSKTFMFHAALDERWGVGRAGFDG